MLLPNLLIAGAPKCGTTSVYDWLITHPEVSGGIDKELFYLLDPTDWKYNKNLTWNKSKEAGYTSFFKEPNKILVDGTTLSIYQDSAIDYATKHKAKAIFILREPTSRVYSTFQYFKDNRSVLPPHMNFSKFIEHVKNKSLGIKNNQLSDVLQQSRYTDFLNKWEQRIGKENMKIFVFEDFMKNKTDNMKVICQWLDIDPEFYNEFNYLKKNESHKIRWRLINILKENIARFIKGRKLKNILRPIYEKLNKMPSNNLKTKDDLITLNILRGDFEDDNKLLANIYDLDLSAWTK
jgi:hypothetical protein